MLTQPGFSHPFRAARMLAAGSCCGCNQGARRGGGGSNVTRSNPAPGSLGPTAALPTPPSCPEGELAGRASWRNFGGKWSLEEELGIPRVLCSHPNWKEPVRSGASDARDRSNARFPSPSPILLTGSPNPQGAGGPGSRARRGDAGVHSIAPGSIALLLALQLSAGIRSGRESHGHAHHTDEGMRASGQGPQRRRRGWATRGGSAVTFRDPKPRQPAGEARALRGPDPRGPARAHQAGPLLAGARRSQHMVGGGAPPRPAETGCSRYRIRDRQRDEGPGLGRRHAQPGRRRQGWGAGEGVARVAEAGLGWGARVLQAPRPERT